MIVVEFTANELRRTQGLISELLGGPRSEHDPTFLQDAELAAHELPRRLRARLLEFKHEEPVDGVLLLKGWPVDDARIGRTPSHWSAILEPERIAPETLLLTLISSLLGESIGWATQQDARLVHHVLPVREHEHEQLGTGSRQLLWWHTEDAFHPFRPDYVTMICMRNRDSVSTTVGSLADVRLEDWQIGQLLQEHFIIKPDLSHTPAKGRARRDGDLLDAYENVDRMVTAPRRVSVLFGDRRSPYLRLDPYFMDQRADNLRAQQAFEELVRQIDANLKPVALAPGDLIVIDNYRAVHGRKPFEPRYDGFDRWLQRMLVVRDLRSSRTARKASNDRVLYIGQEGLAP